MITGRENIFGGVGNAIGVDDITDADGVIFFFTEIIVDGFDRNT